MKTTRRLSVSASYVWEVQNISFLYYCDVIDKHLTFDVHVEELCKMLSQRIVWFLER